MRHAIIDKLAAQLNQRPEPTEPWVMYVLVETRKVVVDHDGASGNYRILRFFCDWVVHARLDRNAAKHMLDDAQNFYRGLDSYLHLRKGHGFSPFMWLIVLRIELRRFFNANEVSSAAIDDDDFWEEFVISLIGIIIDSPLSSSRTYIRELAFVDYDSRQHIACEFRLETGDTQTFISKSTADFI